jgi:hypothetical protein
MFTASKAQATQQHKAPGKKESWIEYGSPARPRRILIDGGTKGTRKAVGDVVRRLGSDATLDLLVVTHIDRDHIDGILDFLEQPAPGLSVSDLWFNSWNHLPGNADEMFGAVQGERLTSRILTLRWPWNRQFHGRAVAIGASGDLPVCPLPHGAKLTLLSPDAAKLAALRPKWDDEVRDANFDVARVILDGGPDVELVFNYRTPINAVWDSPNLQMLHGYRVRYPACSDSGIEVDFDVAEGGTQLNRVRKAPAVSTGRSTVPLAAPLPFQPSNLFYAGERKPSVGVTAEGKRV